MKILGIDYGERKIGISIAETKIAEPYSVLRYTFQEKVIGEILKIIELLRVEKIVIGLSEGKSAQNTKIFGEELLKKISIPLEYFDETLSTQEAINLSIEAGIKRSKRKKLEDSYAATVMLQLYLEKNV
jgi:putative holliday junction resolvase